MTHSRHKVYGFAQFYFFATNLSNRAAGYPPFSHISPTVIPGFIHSAFCRNHWKIGFSTELSTVVHRQIAIFGAELWIIIVIHRCARRNVGCFRPPAHSAARRAVFGFRRFFLFFTRKKHDFSFSFSATRFSPKVAGILPQIPPVSSRREKMKNNFQKSIDILRAVRYNTFCSEQKERKIEIAPIAQLDRAFDYESKGHRFESCWVHHKNP